MKTEKKKVPWINQIVYWPFYSYAPILQFLWVKLRETEKNSSLVSKMVLGLQIKSSP